MDLVKGIGLCAGMESIDVEGATGNLHTNYAGKAEAALNALKDGYDFVYIHVEAPDECGHRNEIENKVRAIELIDELVLGTIIKGMDMRIIRLCFCLIILPSFSQNPYPGSGAFAIYRKSKEKPAWPGLMMSFPP